MTDSKRLKILKALTERFETITPANGYQFDLSPISAEQPRVYRGKASFGAEIPAPYMTILEVPVPDQGPLEAGGGMMQRDNWIITISGVASTDTTLLHPSDPVHNLLADVKKSLGKMMDVDNPDSAIYMLGGLVDGMRIEPGTVHPPGEASSFSYFFLRVVFEVAERLDDPYLV